MPNPPSDGGAQAIHNTTRGLLENDIETNIISVNPSRNFIDLKDLPKEYIDATNFEAVYINTDIKPIGILLNLLRKESYFIERFKSKKFELKLIELLSNTSFDIIQFEHLYLLLYIDLIREYSTAKLIFRPQNVEFIIWKRFIKNLRNPFKKAFLQIATGRLEKFEKTIPSKVDGIITLTKDDANIFKSYIKKTPISDIPMGFDFGSLKDYNFDEQYKGSPIFYHLGSMDWLPNEEAIRWFVDSVLDIVIEKIPDIKIHIAGRNMQDYFYQIKSKNLIIEGEIKDPINYQKDKAIMIVPLLSGSGIRAKIIEGIALGKTIITSSIGAQGIRYKNGENLLIADTPEEFAEAMLSCYQSKELCRKIGRNARELSNNNYHYISIAKEMVNFYEEIIASK